MIDLYIDFDGVILNTIDITYQKLKEVGLSLTNSAQVRKFYEELDWRSLFQESNPIKDSISNIQKLIDSKLYNVSVLSHVSSETEATAKKEFLQQYFTNLNVITVDSKYNKCDVVNCKNAVLVDDYMGNLVPWFNKGGIPIKFSDNGKRYVFITINSLDQLIDKYELIKEKQITGI